MTESYETMRESDERWAQSLRALSNLCPGCGRPLPSTPVTPVVGGCWACHRGAVQRAVSPTVQAQLNKLVADGFFESWEVVPDDA